MKSASIGIIVIFLVITVESAKNDRNFRPRCQKPRDGQQICTCGKNKVLYDRLKGYTCFRGQVVRTDSVPKALERASLRLTSTPLRQSTRDDIKGSRCIVLQYNRTSSTNNSYVPLRNISVEAWIDSFTADVTLSQVFVNQETNPIEAVYVFPIEENAAIYSFTVEIDNRTIVAELKERKKAEKEYQSAVQQGHSAILMRQSDKTFDTFTINVGALPANKECRITVKYVTELDLVEENSIRFVVPTTIAPRYNPSLGHFQSPDQTPTEYVQNTSYSMTFQAHIHRGENYKIINVANLSHPVDLSSTPETIHITSKNISLDRDIILDIDLPINRPLTSVSIEKYNDTSSHAILLAFTPRLSDIRKISQGKEITEKEFIFIVDCSGSMYEANGIGLAREAMLLFIRSLPVGANFNIIRFGSSYRVLFANEDMTVVYNETTAQIAENLTKSMDANLGGTELLSPLKYLKDHPPVEGRAREIFVLTDGEISNTNEVIELCRSMSADTRIFSFGLGYSPSRALVKGLARATNGHFVIVEPNAKVDSYVGSQLGRALQPAIVHARLQWHGLSNKGSQAPQQIPPLYVNDRVLVYQLLENGGLIGQNVSVDLMVNDVVINSIKIPSQILHKKDTIRRLAAKALIQELIHKKNSSDQNGDDEYSEEEKEDEEQDENDQSSTIEYITRLSLHYQILSPYTAFVGVETTGPKVNSSQLQVRYVPIQIAKDDEYINSRQNFGRMPYMSMPGMAGMPMQNINYHFYAPMPMASSSHQRPHSYYSLGAPGPSNNQFYGSLQSLHQKTTQRYPMAPQADQFNFGSSGSSATDQLLSTDPVRWLITKQNFDGTWILSENDIQTLTNSTLSGKLQSKLTNNANALTTAFAIAYLETKQSNQKNLWFTLVEKARKQLLNYGLTQTTLQSLIKEFQTELNA